MAAKVIRVREEAYNRLLNVSRSYGLTIPQAANLLILGSVKPPSGGKRGGEAFPVRGKVRVERRVLDASNAGGTLSLCGVVLGFIY